MAADRVGGIYELLREDVRGEKISEKWKVDVNEVKTLATVFREAMEKTEFSHPQLKSFPYGACGPTAILLSQWLKEHGLENMEYFNGIHPQGLERNPMSHAWIILGELIIDITGDQFKDKTEYRCYDIPVYVGPMDEFHKLFEMEQIHPLKGYESYDLRTQGMFKREYAKVKAKIPELL